MTFKSDTLYFYNDIVCIVASFYLNNSLFLDVSGLVLAWRYFLGFPFGEISSSSSDVFLTFSDFS